jgi:ribonuclease HII
MTFPDFSYEKRAYKKGFRVIAGVDEVGRGSFAGPVVAGAVAFAPNSKFETLNSKQIRINDSKKLNSRERERSNFWIKRNALCYGIGKASVAEINRLGIKKATEVAFRRAIRNCNKRIDYLLIDAFYIPYIKGLRRRNQLPIIRGDTKSVSIAAASIIAKVYRDKLMTRLTQDSRYGKYKWDENKGYGTLSHRKAILRHGVTKQHRKQFVETWEANNKSQESKLQTKRT